MEGRIVTLLFLSPLAGAAGAMVFSLFKWRLVPALWVIASLFAGVALSVVGIRTVPFAVSAQFIAGGWAEGVGIPLRYDGLAALLVGLFYGISALVLMHALGKGERSPLFFAVSAIAVAGMVGVVLSADLFNLFVFFEVLSLSAAFLVADKRSLPAMQAAFRYLLVATLSIALYLLGLFLLYRSYGELSFSALTRLIAADGDAGYATPLAGVLLFSAVATRVALVPFCGWLPEAHAEAPTAVSAILSGLMLKAGFVALWHLIALFPGFGLEELLLWFGAFSALFGAGAALFQEDAKRLLAFSSVSQLGYIAAAAGAGALGGSIYHLLSHALYKSLLFLIVGGWAHRFRVRTIDGLRGVLSREGRGAGDHLSRLLLLLGVASIIGLPPFSAFVSKGLMSAGMNGSAAYPIIQLSGVLTAAALSKLALLGIPKRKGDKGPGVPGLSFGSLTVAFSLVALFMPTLGLGLFPAKVLGQLHLVGLMEVAPDSIPGLYSVARLLESLLVAVGGVVLAGLVRTTGGRRLSRYAGTLRTGVDGSMAFVALGTAVAAGFMLI